MHEILKKYYTGELPKESLPSEFLLGYKKTVCGMRPSDTVAASYVKDAVTYLRSIEPSPYKILSVEDRFDFQIGGHPFIGYIDLLGEKDGALYIVDHKSRAALKERSGRKKPTTSDLLLDDMLKQLYIYSSAVYQRYGKLPDYLCFNCYRTGNFVKERFDAHAYAEALTWAEETIKKIESAADNCMFDPKQDYFRCRYLCGLSGHCEYDIESIEERRHGR